jgi:hypothetical protein
MRYATLGEIPPKRHSQVWREADGDGPATNGNRRLLVEEVLGYEGFSGNESPRRTFTGWPTRGRSPAGATRWRRGGC